MLWFFEKGEMVGHTCLGGKREGDEGECGSVRLRLGEHKSL